MSSQFFSDWMMVLGYVVAPFVFGASLFYGVLRTRRTKPSEVTDRATKAVYDADERERRQKAQAAEKSSRPIDVIKRKTDTTGRAVFGLRKRRYAERNAPGVRAFMHSRS
jgi:hypothetical protein